MMQVSSGNRTQEFARWLRTGMLPVVRQADGIELKFNPWHDPRDGRFTFAGSGLRSGYGESSETGNVGKSARNINCSGFTKAGVKSKVETSGVRQPALPGEQQEQRVATKPRQQQRSPKPDALRSHQPNRAIEFVGGVGEGLYDVGEGAATGAYSLATTDPVATISGIGRGVAGMIDGAIAAEDIPARIQLSRAAKSVANASARDIGHAVGTIAGNGVLAAVAGAAAHKFAALRRLRLAGPTGPGFDPRQIGWVKENPGKESPAKRYNDAAQGARANQAPVLMRKMSDGSTRPVKFDGVQGDYLIDRKTKVMNAPRARAADNLGYFPNRSIDSRFRQLTKAFDVVRKKLGEERYAAVVDLAARAKALFAADQDDMNGKTDEGRELLFEIEDVVRDARKRRVNAWLPDDEGEITGD